MTVLVDSSVWIDYFRGGGNAVLLDDLIDENLIVTNNLIVSELLPFLRLRRERKLTELLGAINKYELIIDWEQIVEFQFKCIKSGINGVGIPDLIIAQNAIQNNCEVYSLDSDFEVMKNVIRLKLVDR